MSQQGMTIVSLVTGVGDTDMGDIEYLAIKEFDGKLRSDEGFLSATGDLATLTANTGKDMYLARAKVTYFSNDVNAANDIAAEIVLKINGTIIETVKNTWTVGTTSDGGELTFDYEFKNTSHKVLAGQIIKLEVISIGAETDVEGFIECFEEDTGDSPQIPPLNPV